MTSSSLSRMPHACPHLAAPVVEVPKVLVRGEATIDGFWNQGILGFLNQGCLMLVLFKFGLIHPSIHTSDHFQKKKNRDLGISPSNLGYPHQFVKGMIWGALKKDLFASSSETQSFSDMPGPDRNYRKTARQVGEAARLISSQRVFSLRLAVNYC